MKKVGVGRNIHPFFLKLNFMIIEYKGYIVYGALSQNREFTSINWAANKFCTIKRFDWGGEEVIKILNLK